MRGDGCCGSSAAVFCGGISRQILRGGFFSGVARQCRGEFLQRVFQRVLRLILWELFDDNLIGDVGNLSDKVNKKSVITIRITADYSQFSELRDL